MELTWAPNFDTQGNVSQLAWMCEGCNELPRWDDCVAAANFDISNELFSMSSKSGKASVENCSLSATPTAYNSILHFLQDLRGSSSAVGLLRLVLRSERRHH